MHDRPVMPETDEAALLSRSQDGDVQAFGGLVALHQDRVYGMCFRVCGHHEDARDLAQEVFIKAFENIGTFRGECKFSTWLIRVAVNLSISHRRKAARRPQRSLDVLQRDGEASERIGDRGRNTADSDGRSPMDLAAAREERQIVAAALGRLPEEFRLMIVLRDIESLDYAEIGRILSTPVGTVKSRLYRARSALADALEQPLGLTSPRTVSSHSESDRGSGIAE